MLSYWTFRYFIILCVGLAIIALCSVYWIMGTAMSNRLKTTGLLGQEIADRLVGSDGQVHVPEDFDALMSSRFDYFNIDKEDLCLIVTDAQGRLTFSRPVINEYELHEKLTDNLDVARDSRFIAVTTPILRGQEEIGKVILLQSKHSLTYSPKQFLFIASLLLTLILCGWLTLYLLSRKLARPIKQVAHSAQQIAKGHYDVNLDIHTKEREINELVGSFKDMAARLKHLEEWRTLSLAGVTHELKTPVTSIKGLLMAVKDGVVRQDEAEEFMDIALKETSRLERMVEDLLHYNAFSSGSLEVRKDELNLQVLMSEIMYQWKLAHEIEIVSLNLDGPNEALLVVGDALRIQQIMDNLLNNALQAANAGQALHIDIRLIAGNERVDVHVIDNGSGILPEEQPYIFERFYRGEHKKRAVRGLGLGLTYSCLLARAQHGELRLEESNGSGSTFVLELPRVVSA